MIYLSDLHLNLLLCHHAILNQRWLCINIKAKKGMVLVHMEFEIVQFMGFDPCAVICKEMPNKNGTKISWKNDTTYYIPYL